MTDAYVSTHWRVQNGREDEFVQMWREALTWTRESYGNALEHARLLRDDDDASHFVSFLEWANREVIDRWSDDPEKQQRQEALEQLCTDVDGSSYAEATRVG